MNSSKLKTMLNFLKSTIKYFISLSLILSVYAGWSGQHTIFQTVFAQEIDVSGKPDAAAEKETARDYLAKIVPERASCLHIINEDYNGDRLSYPSYLFVDKVKDEIYITDSGNGRILIFTHDYYPLLFIGKPDGIHSPLGIAVDKEGYLFVAQSPAGNIKKGRISVFTPSLKWKKDIFLSGFDGAKSFQPNNLAISKNGLLYVTGSAYCGAVVLKKDGTFSHVLEVMDRIGKGEKQDADICDVEIDSAGRIYLLSEGMGRIYVYDDQENFLFKLGKKGGGSGKLSRPRGMSVDERNKRIYVIDYMRHTANLYSMDGRFLFEFGGKGWGRGWFQYPCDISTDHSGNVFIADTFNHRVQVMKLE